MRHDGRVFGKRYYCMYIVASYLHWSEERGGSMLQKRWKMLKMVLAREHLSDSRWMRKRCEVQMCHHSGSFQWLEQAQEMQEDGLDLLACWLNQHLVCVVMTNAIQVNLQELVISLIGANSIVLGSGDAKMWCMFILMWLGGFIALKQDKLRGFCWKIV